MDSDPAYLPKIIAIILLLIFSAYFSATETAYTSLNRIRIKNLASEGNERAKKVLELSEKYDNLLSSILIGNNLVNIALTAIATLLCVDAFGAAKGGIIATLGTALIVLIFGEISPKGIAKEKSEDFAMAVSGVTAFFVALFTPLNFLFGKWKLLIAKLFRLKPDEAITEDELLTIIEEAETEGTLDEERSELIQNAIEFNDLEAWDVLTPRVELSAIELGTDKNEIAALFKDTGFSRLPVYEGDIDHVVGVLNQKDFHNYIDGREADIRAFVKPVVFAPGTMKLPPLLKKMQQSKTHIAVVINEYGGTDGIVTMEDIIEELVGEIYDEHDAVTSQNILPLYDGSYRVLANTELDKFFEFFELDDADENFDANTVNGWVVLLLDKLPKTGDSFECEIEGKLFTGRITKADERKALEINLKVKTLEREDE